MKALESLKRAVEAAENSKPLLVFHWDADGIASAALVASVVQSLGGSVEPYVPPIGEYRLCSELESKAAEREAAVIVDYALPREDLEVLATRSFVVVFDHHLSTPPRSERVAFHNPVALGGDLADYPSTTTVIARELGMELDFRVALGVYGDVELRARETKIWPELSRYMEENDVKEEDLLRAAVMLNYSSRSWSRDLPLHGFKVLLKAEGLHDVLCDPTLSRNYEEVVHAVDRALSCASRAEVDDVLVLAFSSRYYIVSEVARKALSSSGKGIVIVVEYPEGRSEAFIYIRSKAKDLSGLPGVLRSAGFTSGGKREVVGVIVRPRERLPEALNIIASHLGVGTSISLPEAFPGG